MPIPQSLPLDTSLSWPARGLANFLFSMRPGEEATLEDFANLGSCSIEIVQELLNELRQKGHISVKDFVPGRRKIVLYDSPQGVADEDVS